MLMCLREHVRAAMNRQGDVAFRSLHDPTGMIDRHLSETHSSGTVIKGTSAINARPPVA